jgi:hypothetical protein
VTTFSRSLALAFLATALAAPAASAQSAGVVAVTDADGVAHDVPLAGRDDVIARRYAVRDADGGATDRVVTGVSLVRVLEDAGVDPVHVGYVEVTRPGGGALLLSRAQATDPAAFGDGPPVVYADAQGLHLLRPSTGDDDANAADEISAADGRIVLRVRSGRLLDVEIDASSNTVDPREPVTFTATVPRQAAGEPLVFSWWFDDGRSGRGRRVTHRFTRRGSYDVTVGVTSASDDVGASAVAAVQVGAPPDGPDRKGGGTVDRDDAPDSGAADGGGAGAGTEAAPTPRVPRASRSRRAPARRVAPARRGAKPKAPAKAPAATGRLLAGEFVAGEQETAVLAASTPAAARTGRPRPERGVEIPATAWALGGLVLLLGIGWAADMRRSRS